MRSSKSRSRSKSNRPRSIGNIINRVFDSNGPEGKVRGTPQQIIEKYQILAREAQLSNDRVAAENFMQHAEHYTRLLAEAQRELAAEQEARQQQGGQNGQNGQNGQGGNRDRNWQNDRNDNRVETRFDPAGDDQPDVEPAPRIGGMMDFIEDLGESHLVETPETRSREPQRQDRPERTEPRDRQDQRERGPRNDQPRNDQQGRNDRNDRRPPRHEQQRTEQPRAEAASAPTPEPIVVEAAAEAPAAPVAEKAPAARKPRAPRKPKTESGPAEAAE